MADWKEEKSDVLHDGIDLRRPEKSSINLKPSGTDPSTVPATIEPSSSVVVAAHSGAHASIALPEVEESDDKAVKQLSRFASNGIVVGFFLWIIPFIVHLDFVNIGCASVSAVAAWFLYKFFWIVKRKLKIVELSPVKAALSVFLPSMILKLAHELLVYFAHMFETPVPMAVLIPANADVLILLLATLAFAVFWQFKWTWLVGKRFMEIERVASGVGGFTLPRAQLLTAGLLVNLGVFFPTIWYFAVLLIYAKSTQRVFKEWDRLDGPGRHEVISGNKKPGRTNKDYMLLRYQSSAGIEQWLRERFAEKSWKKAAFVLTIVAAFLLFGGPLLMLQALPTLFAVGSAAGGSAASASNTIATANATTTIINVLVNGIILPIFVFFALHVFRTPTHLELTPAGLRFLWRYPLFRREGKTVSWSAVDDVSIKRPFGKTLPQDASLCLAGQGKDLLNAKLKFIPSIDDKATLLEALDKWTPTGTSRAPDVTELLSAPADHSYTELWLQALTAPPKRERLKPLMADTVLKDETYQVNCQIGAGGQGFAYLATNMKNNEKLVLKEYLLPIFVDMESRRRAITNFEMEARTLQSLQSEQIVKLEDFFIEDHRAYLVLEHIDGESLKQLVERVGALKTHNVLQLAAQMCEILHYLHNLTPPLVHRDFTPDNLILRPDGKLKLIDFNVAQKMENEATFTGTIVGKQAYLPPEQFRGSACPASDIYALGCCLYYLLVGSDPEPITVSHPNLERADVPKELDEIVARATGLEVEDRYTSIDDVSVLIHQLLQESS